ncbi:hypothetical protein ES705_43553 [subsurface metagenome]
MNNLKDLLEKRECICVVGLGYVGLPLAVLFSSKYDVIGFDINTKKIEELKLEKRLFCRLLSGKDKSGRSAVKIIVFV